MRSKYMVYTAENVPVLRLSRKPDETGDTIPPSCEFVYEEHVPVLFDDRDQTVVGFAQLKKEKNTLTAYIEVQSRMKPVIDALDLLQRLYPAIGGRVLKMSVRKTKRTIQCFEVECIMLTPAGNLDKTIPPLGDRLACKSVKQDLH